MENQVTEAAPVATKLPVKSSGPINFKDINLILLFGGAVLALVGSFLTWASINVLFFNASIAGIDGDGKITAATSGVLLLLVILSKTIWRGNPKLATKLNYGYLVLALATLAVFAYDATQLLSVDDFGMIKVGIGLYMVGAGAILALITPVKDILKLNKRFGYIALGLIAAVTVGLVILGNIKKDDFSGGNSLESSFNASSNSSTDWTSGWQSSSSSATAVDITVLSKTAILPNSSYEYGYVQGEIKNNTTGDAYITNVTASLYQDGTVVATETAYDYPTMLKAGQTGAYKVSISNFPTNYDEVRVVAEAKDSSWQSCESLDVLSQTAREGDYTWGYGSFDVAGEIKNNTNTEWISSYVYVWLTDSSDKVIDVASTYIAEISANATQPYEVNFSFDTSPNYKAIKVLALACH